MKVHICAYALALLVVSCSSPVEVQPLPNIILIMADDMGYECLGANGSSEYQTPHLDQMAANGMRFDNCFAQPLCTPSRVKIMTGQYNFRNYEYFTYLNPDQQTFGHTMQDAGYQTCIVGKWQLSGLTYQLPGFRDSLRPHQMGFNSYCLWQLNHLKQRGERFSYPLLQQDGVTLPRDSSAYGPDVVSDHALQFIDKHHDQPFFIYYPMLLTHDPFVSTPSSVEWDDQSTRFTNDTSFFADMVHHTDIIVGRFLQKLEEHQILDNTLVIFTADNGCHRTILSNTQQGQVRGAKGNTIDHGTRVPLIISWPDQVEPGSTHEGLVGFADFFTTFQDLIGQDISEQDGISLLPLLRGEPFNEREMLFLHYDPRWGQQVNAHRNQFARTTRYKLYRSGEFFDLDSDILEERPLSNLNASESAIRSQLHQYLDQFPDLPDVPSSDP